MITEPAVQASTVNAWMTAVAAVVRAERDYLSQLDAAIGDGDHGVNMARGFDAVEKALAAQGSDLAPGRLLILSGKTLVSTVGGASGPLWGSGLRRAGRALGDEQSFTGPDLLGGLEAALDAIKDLGAAERGDKTMVDALEPALEALGSALDAGEPVEVALERAADAGEAGARETVPMQARKGRASYLGERSVGHQDPGATSTALIVRALANTVVEQG